MAALLAWCSTLLYQKSKIKTLIPCSPPIRDFPVLNKSERKITTYLDLQVFCFLKAKTDHYSFTFALQRCHSLQILP